MVFLGRGKFSTKTKTARQDQDTSILVLENRGENNGPRFFKDSLEDKVQMVPTNSSHPVINKGPAWEEAKILSQMSPRIFLRLTESGLDGLW